MADAFKILYQGQLGNTVATLATADGTFWIVKEITAVNTDTGVQTFGLCVNGTTGAHQVTSPVISLPASGGYWVWDSMSLTLTNGDTIAGGASIASKITVTIFGDKVS